MKWLRGDLRMCSGCDLSEENIAEGVRLLHISDHEKQQYSNALLRYFRWNPSYFIIAFEKEAPVGFFFCIPIATSYFNEWRDGSHDEAFDKLQLPQTVITTSDFKGHHALLFEVIHVNKKATTPGSAIIYSLMQCFADLLIDHAKKQQFVSAFCADAYNEEGVQLGRILGMQKMRATPSGHLYLTPGIPQKLLQFTASDRPELQQLYAAFFAQQR